MRNGVGVLRCPDSAVRRSEHRPRCFSVRVIARRDDRVTEFGEARLWSETTRLDLRVAEVAIPQPGDRIIIAGEAFVVQGEPVRDRERLVWTLEVRPA